MWRAAPAAAARPRRRLVRLAAGGLSLAAAAGTLAAGPASADASSYLVNGSRGAAVAQVQRGLGLNGTGYYGSVTRRAVMAFQRRAGIQVDGIVGPQTRAALYGGSSSYGSSSSRYSGSRYRSYGSGSSGYRSSRSYGYRPSRSYRSSSSRYRSYGSSSSRYRSSSSSYRSSGGYAIPSRIVRCESGGNYRAYNPSSGAGGAYQILPSTWRAYGGSGSPHTASKAEQDRVAARIWAGGSGRSQWSC
jgi:peptidoglycan hydrolase-like protein with peptidoglycan-binding domain